MSAIAAHHTKSMGGHILLDDVTYVAILLPRTYKFDGLAERLVSDLHQLLVLLGDIAHEEGLVEIAMEATMVDGYIDVTEISVLQRSLVWDAVADHLVD